MKRNAPASSPPDDPIDRETPLGFLRLAQAFHEAGNVLVGDRRRISRLFEVMLYLFGHSIELSLKAYLRVKGVAVKTLKSSPLGHDLVALSKRASDSGLDIIAMSPKHSELIRILNDVYSEKRLEYHRTGFSVLPAVEEARGCSKALIEAVSPLCRQQSGAFAQKKRSGDD